MTEKPRDLEFLGTAGQNDWQPLHSIQVGRKAARLFVGRFPPSRCQPSPRLVINHPALMVITNTFISRESRRRTVLSDPAGSETDPLPFSKQPSVPVRGQYSPPEPVGFRVPSLRPVPAPQFTLSFGSVQHQD